jgi:hypothetical protein
VSHFDTFSYQIELINWQLQTSLFVICLSDEVRIKIEILREDRLPRTDKNADTIAIFPNLLIITWEVPYEILPVREEGKRFDWLLFRKFLMVFRKFIMVPSTDQLWLDQGTCYFALLFYFKLRVTEKISPYFPYLGLLTKFPHIFLNLTFMIWYCFKRVSDQKVSTVSRLRNSHCTNL